VRCRIFVWFTSARPPACLMAVSLLALSKPRDVDGGDDDGSYNPVPWSRRQRRVSANTMDMIRARQQGFNARCEAEREMRAFRWTTSASAVSQQRHRSSSSSSSSNGTRRAQHDLTEGHLSHPYPLTHPLPSRAPPSSYRRPMSAPLGRGYIPNTICRPLGPAQQKMFCGRFSTSGDVLLTASQV